MALFVIRLRRMAPDDGVRSAWQVLFEVANDHVAMRGNKHQAIVHTDRDHEHVLETPREQVVAAMFSYPPTC